MALPDYYEVMNHHEYIDFFHASNSGHFKLMILSISKIFDSHQDASSTRSLKIAHSQTNLSTDKVYEINGITTDQIRELIDETCSVINHVARDLKITNIIFVSDRAEEATLKMLQTLQLGRSKTSP